MIRNLLDLPREVRDARHDLVSVGLAGLLWGSEGPSKRLGVKGSCPGITAIRLALWKSRRCG